MPSSSHPPSLSPWPHQMGPLRARGGGSEWGCSVRGRISSIARRDPSSSRNEASPASEAGPCREAADYIDMSKTGICGTCGKATKMQCSRCHVGFYCDKVCFKKGWKTHKPVCVARKVGKDVPEIDRYTALAAMTDIEDYNVGNLAGRSVTKEIIQYLLPSHTVDSSVLDLGSRNDSLSPTARAQKNLMEYDRIPKLQAARDGDYDIVYADTRAKHVGPPSLIDDCAKVYIIFGNRRQDCSEEFMWLQSGSLAAELYAHSCGYPDTQGNSTFKFLEGGLLYLIGEPTLFWPMVAAYRETGTILPPCAPGSNTSTLLFMREFERTEELLRVGNKTLRKGNPVTSATHSYAHTYACHHGQKTQDDAPHPILDEPLPVVDEQGNRALPTTPEEFPDWWRRLAHFFDGAFFRSGFYVVGTTPRPYRPQCQFAYCPIGCHIAREYGFCVAWHDDDYQRDLMALINSHGNPKFKRQRDETFKQARESLEQLTDADKSYYEMAMTLHRRRMRAEENAKTGAPK